MADKTAVAHHEAAHTVAALMTANNGLLDDRIAVTMATIDGGPSGGNSKVLISSDHPVQAAFIYYAGPWAEARLQWGKPAHAVDDTDEDGKSFRQTVAEKFDFGADSDGACYAGLIQAVPSIPDNEPYWSGQLEQAWPVVEKMAGALLDRLNDAEPRPYLPQLGGNRMMRNVSMTYGEVVDLVKPLLETCAMWRYLS
ncbi:hypothetical protein K883_05229 [Mycobacterium sp. TKK-01-0059]|uniref:hypothetical protein n=1 Tax=Mycobacterium sp. TKK-01-0059 TaxID=1324269 RepID=UPI0004D9ECB8|nr:hypothetical protein [Mycobacterium sp. TKK-01-0059]KEF95044.1 hypothetical protein K883_05229 [Mycobacterium sp. TKK-01-0059]